MSDDKIFVGSGKARTFPDGGSIIACTIDLNDLAKASKEFGFVSDKGNSAGHTKVKVDVKKRREPDQFGNTHYLEVNTWKPTQNRVDDNSEPFKAEDYDL